LNVLPERASFCRTHMLHKNPPRSSRYTVDMHRSGSRSSNCLSLLTNIRDCFRIPLP
jgi:hypothetical protein